MSTKMADYISDSSSESGDELVEDGTDEVLLPLPPAPGSSSFNPVPLPQEPSDDDAADKDKESEGGSSETSRDSQAVPPKMAARAYQLEMLEASLKRNIIVAMDTGSGKTLVAVRRIMAELERSDKLVWFLATTVALASQQFEVIQTQIPSVLAKCICGSDNADSWSKEVWDAALVNVRVVVSTYQILLDAVGTHAFVPFSSLGLVVFDEAHNCVKKNAAARFMKDTYWPAKEKGLPVPHILGLTASPVMGSDLSGIERLESTLDAVCMTPKKHRDELLTRVNRPELRAVAYEEPSVEVITTNSMRSLHRVYGELDIDKDPYVVYLRRSNTERSKQKLRNAIEKRDTYIQKQMKAFCGRSQRICEQIGSWAADYYIQKVITDFGKEPDPAVVDHDLSQELTDPEKRYLAGAFSRVELPTALPHQPTDLSRKVRKLIEVLLAYEDEPVGIVFAKERTTVALLSHILSVDPRVRARGYRAAAMIGISQNASAKKDFLDLNRKGKGNLAHLQEFRRGRLNLLVATSVLEEGIDVPACNLIVCFDPPDDLKSLIQRRGRARKQHSRLCLLLDGSRADQSLAGWARLEEEMKRKYADDMRENQLLERLEETSEAAEYPCLEVESTGARLTIDDAKGHLEHFCATLLARKFVDWTPYYVIHNVDGGTSLPGEETGQHWRQARQGQQQQQQQPSPVTATVHLPASLAPELRRAESRRAWLSEKNACKDAAFQAYAALYRAGLLNEHLLPIRETGMDRSIEKRPGMANVKPQLNPWSWVARAWRDEDENRARRTPPNRYRLTFARRRLDDGSSDRGEFVLVLPGAVPAPALDPLTLYWDADPASAWLVTLHHDDVEMSGTGPRSGVVDGAAADHTFQLLRLAYGHRWRVEEKPTVVRFVSLNHDLSGSGNSDDGDNDNGMELCEPFSLEAISNPRLAGHLVRDPANQNHPYFYLGWLAAKPPAETVRRPYLGFEDDPEDVPYIVVKNWPKKAGYFHPAKQSPSAPPRSGEPVVDASSRKLYQRVLPAGRAVIETVRPVHAYFGMAIPAITHALGVRLLASDLMVSRLAQIGLTDLGLVATAISATSARLPWNYERIEFLGDTILKFCATIYCSAMRPAFVEGQLSGMKDGIVSNLSLCRAAIDFGLDQYIVTKTFTLDKWRPTYVEDVLALPTPPVPATRELSTKTIADVVEALIGAAFIEGGIPKALGCIAMFLPRAKPEDAWVSVEEGRRKLYDRAAPDVPLPANMHLLERLLGYTFRKKSLLVEAMTHASLYVPGGPGAENASPNLERLEFLGDAILDYIVVTRLFDVTPHLKEDDMHLIRTCLVNADFLGYQVMEWSVAEDTVDVIAPGRSTRSSPPSSPRIEAKTIDRALWAFMRHASPDLGLLQRATAARHTTLGPALREALRSGGRYPWALLARLQAQKVFSDVFESVLGAVWVDSGGSLDACAALLERAGLLPYMRRMLADRVHARHPKEDLGRDARDEKVRYEVTERVVGGAGADGDTDSDVDQDPAAEREFLCKVYVGGRLYADVADGVSREEVRTRAADEALKALARERERGVAATA